ncbi:MAG: hypothetical protein J6B92_11085 [Paraprevotella sp.]|nr:hypothetical protein [Paraprevotella sp.]MBP3470792.1 hypothetical protein [Paraprevotella sp.]
MTKKRTIVGISAILCLVALNLRHAWNNYGITEDSWVKEALATPPTDPPKMHECGSENGNTKYCNARDSHQNAVALCNHYYSYVKAKRPTGKPKNGLPPPYELVTLEERHGATAETGWMETIPDYRHLYVSPIDYITNHYKDKILEGSEYIERHSEEIAISTSFSDCVYDGSSASSCIKQDGFGTICNAEIDRRYGNGTN